MWHTQKCNNFSSVQTRSGRWPPMFFMILGTYRNQAFIGFSPAQRIQLMIFSCHTVTHGTDLRRSPHMVHHQSQLMIPNHFSTRSRNRRTPLSLCWGSFYLKSFLVMTICDESVAWKISLSVGVIHLGGLLFIFGYTRGLFTPAAAHPPITSSRQHGSLTFQIVTSIINFENHFPPSNSRLSQFCTL